MTLNQEGKNKQLIQRLRDYTNVEIRDWDIKIAVVSIYNVLKENITLSKRLSNYKREKEILMVKLEYL